jgi:hypothetical protein
VQRCGNEQQVLPLQQLHMHAGEAVEEGAGQALAPTPLLHRVLCPKQAEGGGAAEGAPQLRDEHLRGGKGGGGVCVGVCEWCRCGAYVGRGECLGQT